MMVIDFLCFMLYKGKETTKSCICFGNSLYARKTNHRRIRETIGNQKPYSHDNFKNPQFGSHPVAHPHCFRSISQNHAVCHCTARNHRGAGHRRPRHPHRPCETPVHRRLHRHFRSGQEAWVYVSGDGDTDLDLYIYDENGNLIDSDTDSTDECLCTFTPRWTGQFKIKIKNYGNVYNEYQITTSAW